MDALRQHVPSSKEKDLLHIKTVAMKFEEKIYSMATSQDDYLKKISLKMVSTEEKFHKMGSNSLGSDSSCTADILPHSASHNMHSKTNVPQPPVTTQSDKQSQVHQQHILQNTPEIIASPGVQGSTRLPSVRPLISGSAHTSIPNVSAENPTQQNISSISHSSVGNSVAHRASAKTSVGHERQLLQNQQHGLTCQNYCHQQSQPQILKQFTIENVSGSFQTRTEQEGQNQKDQQQLQRFQQHVCYQPQHAHHIHPNLLPLQKQPHMMGQRVSTFDVQQGQLINHQNNVAGVQQHRKMFVNGCDNSSMQRDAVALQGQMEHSASASLQAQGQYSHPQPREKHLFSHSKPANLQQVPIQSQQDMQHTLQTSAAIDCRSPTKEHASLKKDEKEALARIEHMKKKYLPAVDLHQKMVFAELQSHGSLFPQANPGPVEQKLKRIQAMLVNIASFLEDPQNKSNAYERLDLIEERINDVMKQVRQLLPLNVHSVHQTQLRQRPPPHAQIVVEPQPITSSTRLLPDGSTSLSELHMPRQNMKSLELNPIAPQNMHQNVQMLKPRREIDEQQMHLPLTQQRRQVVQQPQSEFLNTGMGYHQMNEVKNVKLSSEASVKVSQNQTKEIKSKTMEGSGIKPEALQQHQSVCQCSSHPHHRCMSGSLLSAYSSELLQSVTQYKNKSNMPGSQAKADSALRNRNSPSIPCIVPKSTSVSPLSNGGNDENQKMKGAVATPRSSDISETGVSTSPQIAASNNLDIQCDALTSISDESSVAEQAFQRLLKVVKSMSAKALRASVNDIESIVSVTDMVAEVSIPFGGSRGAIGEDLCAMTTCCLQASWFDHMDDALGTRKRKRGTSQMPLDVVNGCFDMDKSRLDSSATSCTKWPIVETKLSLLEEIWKVNQRLIDTVVDINDKDGYKTSSKCGEGTIVTCSFNAVAVNPNIMMSSTLSLWLLVPINYPNCSPALLDNLPSKLSKKEDLSEKAKARLKRSLESLEHPLSIGKIARTWDCCAREVVLEQVMQYGGGTFTSKYGGWDNCRSAA